MYILNEDFVRSLKGILEETETNKTRVMVAEVLGNVREFNMTMKLAEQAHLISEEIKYLDRVISKTKENERIQINGHACPATLRSTVKSVLLESLENLRQQKEDELSGLGEDDEPKVLLSEEPKVCKVCWGEGEVKIHGDFRTCPHCSGEGKL